MELVTLVTLLGISFIFAYASFNFPKTNKSMRIFLLLLSLSMIYLTAAGLYSASLGKETRLANQTILCHEHANNTCINQTITNNYANYTRAWSFGPSQTLLSIVGYTTLFVAFYLFIILFISLINWILSIYKLRKGGGIEGF